MTQKHLVILGGGFAGTSAALEAAEHSQQLGKESELKITLINSSQYLYIRPRFYEYELEETRVPLASFLQPIGVDLIKGIVHEIEFTSKKIVLSNAMGLTQEISYEALVIALGSQLENPPILGIDATYNIDTFDSALAFREALSKQLRINKDELRIAILGGGFTGLELATELPVTIEKMARGFSDIAPKIKVFILDRHDVTSRFGESLTPELIKALEHADIECVCHANVDAIEKQTVFYNGNQSLKADLIVSTLGLRAHTMTKNWAFSKDMQGRVYVNPEMQLPKHPECFMAGDCAHAKPDESHDPVMSCQQARPQGRQAGYNAVSFLFGETLAPYQQPKYVTCIDLGAYGAAYTEGWDRQLKCSQEEGKKIKKLINCERIYPPKPKQSQY